MGNLLKETKYIMKKYGMVANKSLGQNFLIDETVVEEIVKAANITKEDLVIEIGPGLGTLTAKLLEKANKVLCIELDNRMISILKERFAFYSNLEILHQDVLTVDLNQKMKEEKAKGGISKVKIVANLPYYITTPIMMKLLEENLEIESITVMIQKEVAERLCSKPGDRKAGAITHCVYYYAVAEEVLSVPKEAFLPEPEVASEVIQLTIRKQPPVQVKNKETMFQLIKASFRQRRKTLANSLVNSNIVTSKEEMNLMLEELKIDGKTRGETLTLEQFAEMADYIEKRKRK